MFPGRPDPLIFTLLKGFAAQLLGVRRLLIERGSLQRPTRHLSCPAPVQAAGPNVAHQPWCRVGESLAQDWQILGVDPEVAQERGSRRLEQDFFRLISNIPQSVAAQGAPGIGRGSRTVCSLLDGVFDR